MKTSRTGRTALPRRCAEFWLRLGRKSGSGEPPPIAGATPPFAGVRKTEETCREPDGNRLHVGRLGRRWKRTALALGGDLVTVLTLALAGIGLVAVAVLLIMAFVTARAAEVWHGYE